MSETTAAPASKPAYDKPLPSIEPGTQPYWDALRRHELIYQRCRSCGHQYAPYQPVCPKCLGEDIEERQSSGHGKIYTFSVVHRAPTPAFKADLPYAVAIVELDEGFYLTTGITGCPADQVAIGMPVEVEYFAATESITLAKFKPRRA